MKENKIKNNKGQIALIILVIMAIGLTLGLSLSQRVITDLEITQEEEKSAQAFSAAEGGVEEALRILDQGGTVPEGYGSLIAGDLGVDSLEIESTALGGTTEFLYPETLEAGWSIIIWLRDHDENGEMDLNSGYEGGSIEICWDQGTAIEIIYFYDKGANNYDISHYAYDSDSGRTSTNQFNESTGGGCAGLDASETVNLENTPPNIPLFMVVRPFYGETRIGADGDTNIIPEQGYEVVSSAEITRSETEKISRRIKVFRGWEIPPEFFYHSVFANTGVTTQ